MHNFTSFTHLYSTTITTKVYLKRSTSQWFYQPAIRFIPIDTFSRMSFLGLFQETTLANNVCV